MRWKEKVEKVGRRPARHGADPFHALAEKYVTQRGDGNHDQDQDRLS